MVCLQCDTESTLMTACGDTSVHNRTVKNYLVVYYQSTLLGGRAGLVLDISILSGQCS